MVEPARRVPPVRPVAELAAVGEHLVLVLSRSHTHCPQRLVCFRGSFRPHIPMRNGVTPRPSPFLSSVNVHPQSPQPLQVLALSASESASSAACTNACAHACAALPSTSAQIGSMRRGVAAWWVAVAGAWAVAFGDGGVGAWDDEALGVGLGYDAVTRWVEAFASSPACASVAGVRSLGRSAEGREVWAVEVSDRPGEAEAEPAFRVVAGMHGDEGVGVALVLRLAQALCDASAEEAEAEAEAEGGAGGGGLGAVVRGAHTWLVPMANPDGVEGRRRENARGVDLNRDFPDPVRGEGEGVGRRGREPETEALMRWMGATRAHAGASLHGGALAVCYPWDGTATGETGYAAAPDDAQFRHLASAYASRCEGGRMGAEGTADPLTGARFEGGATNGAAWYPVYGGMQDYGYVHGGSLEVTIEVGARKWPAEAEAFGRAWRAHGPALGALLVAATLGPGVTGAVVDAATGAPIPGARVRVDGLASPPAVERVGDAFGDFHRVLAPRDAAYVLRADAPGYDASDAWVVMVRAEGGARPTVEFALRRSSTSSTSSSHPLGARRTGGGTQDQVPPADGGAYVRPDVLALALARRHRRERAAGGWLYAAILGLAPVTAIVLAVASLRRPSERRARAAARAHACPP